MRFCHDDVLDTPLDYLAANVTRRTVCSQPPTTYTEANATYKLAQVTLSSGDFSKSDGVSGRKTTVAAKTGLTIDTPGIATHESLLDVSGTKLLYVTEIGSVYATGTAQDGGASDITLEAGASAADDFYNGYGVRIVSGTGTGQSKLAADYNGTTKVLTVDSAWDVQPDATSVYEVFGKNLGGDLVNIGSFDIEFDDPTAL